MKLACRGLTIIVLIASVGALSSCNSDLDDSNSSGKVISNGGNGGGTSTGGAVIPPGSPGNPNAPNTLLVKAYSSSILLAWTPPGKTGPYTYGVYRRTAIGSYQQLANALNVTTFNDTTALNGVPYTYKIRATNLSGESSDTNEASAEAIASYSITSVVQAANNDVTVTWTPGAGADSYDIVSGSGNGDFNTVLKANATSPTVLTGLVPGTTYQIQILARNSVGLGAEVRSATVARVVLMNAFGFTLSGVAAGMSVNWGTVPGVDSFDVSWGTASGNYSVGTTTVKAPATSYVIPGSGLVSGTQYYVMVRAHGGMNLFYATAEQTKVHATPVTITYPYSSGSTSLYTSSSAWSNVGLSLGGVATLGQMALQDQDGTLAGWGGGTAKGVIWDAGNGVLRLGNAGGCDGGTSGCGSELDSSWTPQWANLVSYWKMNNNWNDSKGTNQGTAVNAIFSASTKKLGSHAGSFSSGAQYVTLPANPFSSTSYTVCTWFNSNNASSNTVIFGARSSTAVNPILAQLYKNAGKIMFVVRDNAGVASTLTGTTTLASNSWYFACGVRSGNALTVYVNGVQEATGSASFGAITNNLFTIGSYYFYGSGYQGGFDGLIDDLMIWKTSLTIAEIKIIYNTQVAKFSGTIASRVFDGGTTTAWGGFNWSAKIPFGKELPDGGAAASETTTDYPSLSTSTLMNNIVGLWHLNETTTGTVSGGMDFADSSGNGRHGKIAGSSVSFSDGKFRTGVTTSSSGYIQVTTPAMGPTWTASAWFKYPLAAATNGWNTLLRGSVADHHIIVQRSNMHLGSYYSGAFRDSGFVMSSLSVGWHQVAAVAAGGSTVFYVDGKQVGTIAFVVTNDVKAIGNYQSGLQEFGSIDEVAIWSRALNVAEIQQLYRRGGNRIKFQARTCATANAGLTDCTDGSAWQGPDGSSSTYFSELNNNSVPLAMTGSVLSGLPTMLFLSFTSPLSAKRYVQYQAVIESDDTLNLCNYGAGAVPCSPELTRVAIMGSNVYDFSGPSLYGNTGLSFSTLSQITEILGAAGCSGGIGYNLSLDKTTWYYSTGTSWLVSDGTAAKSASASVTNAGLASFGTQVGIGTVYVRTFLRSSGSTPCELDSVQLDGFL